jgi:hypothetical protein
MCVVQISLFSVTFLSLISQNLSLTHTTKEVNPHPHIAPCVNMWSVTFLFFFFFCHLLNVGACICHTAQEGRPSGVDHTTPHHTTPLICFTLYASIISHATLIQYYHASMLTLQNSIISHALWWPQM